MTIRTKYSFNDNGKTKSNWIFQFIPTSLSFGGIEHFVVYFVDNNSMYEHCICQDMRNMHKPLVSYENLIFYDCAYKDLISGMRNPSTQIENYEVSPDKLSNFLISLIIKRTSFKDNTISWHSEPH